MSESISQIERELERSSLDGSPASKVMDERTWLSKAENQCLILGSQIGGISALAGANAIWPSALTNSAANGASALCVAKATALTCLPYTVGAALTALGIWGMTKVCEDSEQSEEKEALLRPE